jgi:hypothetical protein
MEAVHASETLIHLNITTRHYVLEDSLNFILVTMRTWNLTSGRKTEELQTEIM